MEEDARLFSYSLGSVTLEAIPVLWVFVDRVTFGSVLICQEICWGGVLGRVEIRNLGQTPTLRRSAA